MLRIKNFNPKILETFVNQIRQMYSKSDEINSKVSENSQNSESFEVSAKKKYCSRLFQ